MRRTYTICTKIHFWANMYIFWKFWYFSEIFETSTIFYSHNYIENCFKTPKISWNDAKFSRFIEFSIYFYQNASKCHRILFWSYFEYSEYISKLFWMLETLFVSAWTQKHRLMNWKRCILMILGTLHMFSAWGKKERTFERKKERNLERKKKFGKKEISNFFFFFLSKFLSFRKKERKTFWKKEIWKERKKQ